MKPSIPKGTRDFLPEQSLKRAYIFDTIKATFIKYGFQPIETPAMENLQVLTGKYGEEGDKLLFKVLNNGDFLSKADSSALESKDSIALIPSISKRGLRYDLTVPFARFVVMNRNDIQLPFKRYQIQPVWRADRPQKGRYQEFYQCDADVVGSESLLYEAELVQIYDEVFSALGIEVTISINNRKVLSGIAEVAGIQDKFMDMTIAIDKLDKIGIEGVRNEMAAKGIEKEAIDTVVSILDAGDDIDKISEILTSSETGMKGVDEIKHAVNFANITNELTTKVQFDPTLARGLDYYTGCILEVKANHVQMGSIGGGGRYDDLTGAFGMDGIPGVGISFGAERIYDVMEELGLFPKELSQNKLAIFLSNDIESLSTAFEWCTKLRRSGVHVDIYPEAAKMKKQFKYANDCGFTFALIIGESERKSGQVSVKNMTSGDQSQMSYDELLQLLTAC